MTKLNQRSQDIMTAFYRSCLGKEPCWENDRLAVSAAIREVANRLCTDLGELEDPITKLREIADELEVEND